MRWNDAALAIRLAGGSATAALSQGRGLPSSPTSRSSACRPTSPEAAHEDPAAGANGQGRRRTAARAGIRWASWCATHGSTLAGRTQCARGDLADLDAHCQPCWTTSSPAHRQCRRLHRGGPRRGRGRAGLSASAARTLGGARRLEPGATAALVVHYSTIMCSTGRGGRPTPWMRRRPARRLHLARANRRRVWPQAPAAPSTSYPAHLAHLPRAAASLRTMLRLARERIASPWSTISATRPRGFATRRRLTALPARLQDADAVRRAALGTIILVSAGEASWCEFARHCPIAHAAEALPPGGPPSARQFPDAGAAPGLFRCWTRAQLPRNLPATCPTGATASTA